MYGLILMDHAPASWSIQPGLYAIVAATAVLGGVFRSSISLVVIVVEGTRGINFLFGIIIAVVVSNYVAHLIHYDGVYESELERDGNVFYLRSEPPHALRHTTAQQVNLGMLYTVPCLQCKFSCLFVLLSCLRCCICL